MTDWTSLNDGYYYVYYLPEEHYVGLTNNIRRRMMDHRRLRNGQKFTNDYEILGKFESNIDAHWFEIQFHQRGYNGFNTKNNYAK